MNILQKGLALVAVPLLFEIGFAYTLLSQNEAIEKEKHEVKMQKALVDCIDSAIYTYMDAAGNLSLLNQTGNQLFADKFADAMELIPGRIAEAEEITKSVPVNAEDVRILRAFSNKVSAELFAIQQISKGPMTPTKMHDIAMRRERLTPAMAEFASIMEHFHKRQQASEQREEASRKQVKSILIAGLGLNVFVALALALWFSLGTIRRLRILVDNARRIGSQLPLQPAVKGNDEISHLDAVMHDVGRSLGEAQLREQELNALKEEFYAMLTHDLRSPLTSVWGSIELIKSGVMGEIPERALNLLEGSDRSLAKVLRLVNEFLDLKKLEAGKDELSRVSTSIDEIIVSAIEVVQMQASEKQQTLVYEPLTVGVFVDPDKIERVVINLLTNAIKFSAISAGITIDTIVTNDFLRIEVQDSGPGIADVDKERVFERFAQAKSDNADVKGTGLGLPICKLLIEEHSGTTVWAKG